MTIEENTKRILRLNEICKKIGLGKSAIYDRLNLKSVRYDSAFPQPIKLGSGLNPPIGFIESEIDAWIETQIRKSRGEA